MFWSGNYIAVRELNSLLKEENVTLSQVLEADDILQECKADNKALVQFLTKPEILADLITLITEEPPKNLELASQYRHANIACEVLTSHLSMLSDRLSLDVTQMNRLCDFLNKDPPLNPLLASYFSKTVEMLLEKNPKQDWCLHHIVCLRVLDFFKSRRDFLPNLFKHMSTSAIADIFKCFMRIDELIKTVMEWLEEHQFLECLIQIICGTYVSEVFPSSEDTTSEAVEKAQQETTEKVYVNHTDDKDEGEAPIVGENDISKSEHGEGETANGKSASSAQAEARAEAEARTVTEARMAAAASANAAALLCDLIVNDCRLWSVRRAVSALRGERGTHALLRAMFTSPRAARPLALVNGTHVLLALLHHHAAHAHAQRLEKDIEEEAQRTYTECEERSCVELAVAPHLPLLHQELLQEPEPLQDPAPAEGRVGLARVQVAALLAHLAMSEVEEVATTMITLGTPGVLVDMFFKYKNNNFLHAQVYTLVKHALANRAYRTQYARHLLIECDLLTRLMDVFEENRNNKEGSKGRARDAYMGHAVLCLAACARALGGGAPPAPDAPYAPDEPYAPHATALPPALSPRWHAFLDELRPLLHQHDTPLGGYYPPENFYEAEVMPEALAANYEFNDIATSGVEEIGEEGREDVAGEGIAGGSLTESANFIADGLGLNEYDQFTVAKNNFMELACQRIDDDMWDEPCDGDAGGEGEAGGVQPSADLIRDVLDQRSPWESTESGSSGGEGWAQFGRDPFAPPPGVPPSTPPTAPPAAPHTPPTPPADEHFAEFTPFWSYDTQPNDANTTTQLESNLRTLRLDGDTADKTIDEASSVELANNLLTAMSAMSPDAIANIVNANLTSPPPPIPAPSTTPGGQQAPGPTPGVQQAPSTEHR